MKQIVQTRFFHWKKQWLILLFWLLFPIIATFLLVALISQIQSEMTVPVGVVVEEETPLAQALYTEVAQTSFLRVHETTKAEALHLLEKHELDSVFIIHDGYENQIRSGSRNGLLTSYQSNTSFAYTPVKERFLSYVPEDTGRAKAAYTIQHLSETYNGHTEWTFEEIVATSKAIQAEEKLLETDFSFENIEMRSDKNSESFLNVWELWTIFSLLSTLLLSEWVIKEKKAHIPIRLAFTRIPFKNYLIRNLLLYIALFFTLDLIAYGLFSTFLSERVRLPSFVTLICFRVIIQLGSFLIALSFKNLYRFYSMSFAITLLFALFSGSILPVTHVFKTHSWLEILHPFQSITVWFIIVIVFICVWYFRKEKSIA